MCDISLYPKPCERDYESHINNTHCQKYYEINIFGFEVQEVQKHESYLRKFISEGIKKDSQIEELLKKVM